MIIDYTYLLYYKITPPYFGITFVTLSSNSLSIFYHTLSVFSGSASDIIWVSHSNACVVTLLDVYSTEKEKI
jgi:hypothetical protein